MPGLACAGAADASTLIKRAIDAKARAIGNKSLRFHTAALAAGEEPTKPIEVVVLRLAAQTKHSDAMFDTGNGEPGRVLGPHKEDGKQEPVACACAVLTACKKQTKMAASAHALCT